MRKCKVKNKDVFIDAYFHKWNDFENVVGPSPIIGGAPGGQIKYTLGLVEYIDSGVVKEVVPNDIIFIDDPDDIIKENTMYQSLAYHQHETVREILCDKYGIEGDDVDEMIDEIICGLNNLKIF